MNITRTILIWEVADAPSEYIYYCDDVDYIAFVPDGVYIPPFLSEGSSFGCCTVHENKVPGGTILTGCHA